MAVLCQMCKPRFGSGMTLISNKLDEANEKNHTDCVEVLLQIQDSLSDWPGTVGKALVEAAGKGRLGLVRYLFQLKPYWLLGDLQEALCKAMYHGHTHIMEFLIASATNADGQTPLMLATVQGDVNMVKYILQAGADVNRMDHKNWQTALMEAAINGSVKIAKLLIEAGADVNMGNKFGHTALILAENNIVAKVLIEAGADVNKPCCKGQTPLSHFAIEGNEEGVRLLIKAGATVNTVDKLRDTALMLAMRKCYWNIAETLIEAGAYVNISCANNETALFHCVSEGKEKGVQLLAEAGANVNTGDTMSNIALIIAVRKGNLSIAEVLIRAGADVNKVCTEGRTALLHCASKGNREGVRLLVEAGANVNIADKLGVMALLVAATEGYFNIVKVLIRAGADVNKVCTKNYTALSHFVLKNDVKAVRFLLRSGAKVNIGTQPDGPINDEMWLLLIIAGQRMNVSGIRGCMNFTLQCLCRATIWHHLVKFDPHENLFVRIPRLGLPSLLADYLLFGVSLDENHNEDN